MQEETIERTLTLSAPVEFVSTKRLKASARTIEAMRKVNASAPQTIETIRKTWRPKTGPAKDLKTTEPESLPSAEEAVKIKMAKLREEWRPKTGPLAL